MAAKAKAKAQEPGDGLMTMDELLEMRGSLAEELGGDVYFGDDPRLELKKLPLGIPSIDNFLGGGFAFDRVVELIGDFSAGKSTLAIKAIAAAQQRGLSTAVVDVEKSFEPEWTRALGADPTKVLVTRPRTGEQAFNQALDLVRKRCGVIVFDSLAEASPNDELEAEKGLEQGFMGLQARMNNRGIRNIVSELNGSLVILINQIRESVGVVYGNPEVIPGGKGQKFAAWQLIRVRRGPWIEEGEGRDKKRMGYHMRLQMVKNKQGPPEREAEIPFYFTGEIDEIYGLVESAMQIGAITKDGSRYYVGTEKVIGRAKLLEYVKAHKDVQDMLTDALESVEALEF